MAPIGLPEVKNSAWARNPIDRFVLARLESVNDSRRETYLTLLAVINGWPAPESLTPVLEWSSRALAAN